VICLDARTGRISGARIWACRLSIAPVVSGGASSVSTHDNHFYALAENDGRNLWVKIRVLGIRAAPGFHQRRGSGETVIAPYTSGENLRSACRTARWVERSAVAHRHVLRCPATISPDVR